MPFKNINPTPQMAEGVSYFSLLRDFFKKDPLVKPPAPLPFVRRSLLEAGEPELTWFGHSSYLLRSASLSILVDPVFSGNASPVPGTMKAFPGSNEYGVHDMPPVDLLVLTHDHYDHLDKHTVIALRDKVKKVVCPLEVEKILTGWGYDPSLVNPLGWWDRLELPGVVLTAMPARHFSGRGLRPMKTLWVSYQLEWEGMRLYLGGDSGFDDHFDKIGREHGPFDLAILECGQYNEKWPLIHMFPEQTVDAAVALRARCLLPVHWAKFPLAFHAWDDSIKRVVKAAWVARLPVITPQIGEKVTLRELTGSISEQTAGWWEKIIP